jgi:TolC family type I secretion outer membrane protein
MSQRPDLPRPNRLRLAALAASLLGGAFSAWPGSAETLGEVVAYAYQVNPGVQAQRAAMRALDESYVSARAGYAPNVSVSAGLTDYDLYRSFDPRTGGGTAQANTQSQALSIIQPLYTGGRVINRVRATEAQIRAGRQTLRRFEVDLLQRVVQAYVGVQRDEQVVKITTDIVAVLTRELADAQARFDVREVTRTDLSQAKARLAQAKTQMLSAQAQLGASRAQFLGVVGRPPGTLAPVPPIDALPPTAAAAFDAAEANNPQLQSARDTEASSRAAIAQAKAERMPSITARFDIQRTPTVPYSASQYDRARSGSITISQPLFTGGQIQSGVRRSIENNNRDRLTIDDTRLSVVQQVSTAWEQVVALRQQLTTAQEEMRADQIAFAGVRQEQKAALRSTIEVLNAALELSNAEQNLARVRAAEYLSRVELLAAVGVLTPQMLSADTEVYDPSKNFRKIQNDGVTPVELPVRVLEAITNPQSRAEAPASIAEARPTGSPLPPKPTDSDLPIVSIYSMTQTTPAAKP